METRTAVQGWVETNDPDIEYQASGWRWYADKEPVNLDEWELMNITRFDDFHNPMEATFKRINVPTQENVISVAPDPSFVPPQFGFTCGICGNTQPINEGNAGFHSLRICDNCKHALKAVITKQNNGLI